MSRLLAMAHGVADLVLLSLVLSACSAEADVLSEPQSDPQPTIELKQYPARIVNEAGVADTRAYSAIPRRSTDDHPYGPLAGGAGYEEYATPRDLVEGARAALVADIVEIGQPHYNSDDGGFWIPEPDSPAARLILQDVLVRTVERWGNRLDLGDVFELTVTGGQIEVTVNAEQARGAELPGPGTYLESVAPHVELAEGERVLLFLTRQPIDWKTASGKVSQRQVIHVLGGFQGKWLLRGDVAENRMRGWSFPLPQLKAVVSEALGADPGQN